VTIHSGVRSFVEASYLASALLVLAGAACGGTTTPSADSPYPATAAPITVPSFSPPPEPTVPAATQADVIGAVGKWLAGHLGSQPTGFTYVDVGLSGSNTSWYNDDSVPELRNVGASPFGDELTEGSEAALSEVLRGVTVEFVEDPQSVVDPNGFEHFGCRPYLQDRTMVHFGAPLPRRDDPATFYVVVNFDRGCGGDLYLLEVGRDDAGYSVTRVIRQGNWIV